eukprot:905207-Amphidinium_carterae.1
MPLVQYLFGAHDAFGPNFLVPCNTDRRTHFSRLASDALLAIRMLFDLAWQSHCVKCHSNVRDRG